MRKICNSIMLVAASAIAFASCQKEFATPETFSTTLTLSAGVEETKTYLDDKLNVLWGKGESLSLYIGSGSNSKFVPSDATDKYDGLGSAEFTFALENVVTSDSYRIGGIYPASAAMTDNENPAKFKTILPQIQNAEVGKYDPSAYIMVLKPDVVDELPSEYQAYFRRATALNKITLTGVKEDISTVEITVPEGMALAGRRYFDLTEGTSGEIYYGQSNTIAVNAPFTGTRIDVWFCSWGVELEAGQELTVRMKNADKAYTRTIAAKDEGIAFVEGNLNLLEINMATAEEESFNSFAGEWLITGTTGGVTYAAGPYVSGNNIKASVPITVSNDMIDEVDGLENCKMLFTKIIEGEYEGMYTIQDANGKYLYAASSSGNQLKAGTSVSGANYYWTVECADGKYSVVASKSSNRNVMQFNGADASNLLFACYSSASQSAITLYPYSMVKVDTTPKIVVSGETTKDVVFGGDDVTFNYELKFLDGEELIWEVSDEDMITSVTAEDGVLTVTVAGNDSDARTATITLSCGDADDVVLTINQTEYVDTSVIEEISVADFLAKSVDANVWYQLTGTVSNIANTQYGNFNLVDATGTVYVYGLTATKVVSNDQSFASIGLNEGDVVTLIGTRAVYNNNAQVGGPAYYVSHQQVSTTPSISCKDNVVTITAATGATIYYTTDGTTPSTESTKYTAAFDINEDTTVKAISLEEGKLASSVAETKCTWVDPNGGNQGIALGASYSYTFSAEQWGSNGAKTLGTLSWTVSGSYNGSGYWGYDGTKGQQFGSSKAQYTSLKVATSAYSGGVKTIKVSTSGASSIKATLTVTVNGKQYGSVVSLTSSNNEYTFEVDDADVQAGEIVLSYTNSSAKAIYIKSIAIN